MLLGLSLPVRAADAPPGPPVWPEVPPEQLREDFFGVKLRLTREMSGDQGAKRFLLDEMARDPQPHVQAYFAWYCLFSKGWGVPEMFDPAKGKQVAEEAIQGGSMLARDVLGRAMVYDVGHLFDARRGMTLIREAAEGGVTRSMVRLAYSKAVGWNMPQDLAAAEKLAQRAAELGQPGGLFEIGEAFEKGQIGDRPDLDRAIRYYYAAAWHADSDAWRRLLELDKKGIAGARRSLLLTRLRQINDGAQIAAESVIRKEIVELAAIASDDPATFVELGRARITGEFVKRDQKMARELLAKAVTAGHGPARFFLAQMKLRGQGGPKEPAALGEIREMADAGDPYACAYLGWLYYWGVSEARGLKKDERLAFEYCRRAAERGLPVALMNLGLCYQHGIGTPENYGLAAKVYWQAFLRDIPAALEEVRRLVPHVKI